MLENHENMLEKIEIARKQIDKKNRNCEKMLETSWTKVRKSENMLEKS